MFASWITKRMIRSVFDKVGAQGNAEAGFANMTDDCTYDIPVELSVGGTVQGKKAVIDWYHRWYEQFPKRKLIPKSIAFAAWPLSPRNVCMMEWTCE
jgi:hypothetical protein